MGKKFARDPNAPKRPMTPFMAWAQGTRAQITANNPGAGVAEIGKALGAAWGQLSEAEKTPFQEEYAKEKEAFNTASAAYKATDGYATYQAAKKAHNKKFNNKRKLKKLKKMLANAPKRPQSGYFLFAGEKRASLTGSLGEIGKQIGELWNGLSDGEKAPYLDRAKAAKATYDAENAEYRLTDEYKAYEAAVKAARKDTPERREKEKAKAKKAKEKAKADAEKAKAKAKRAKASAKKKAAKAKASAKKAKATARKKAALAKKKERKEAARAKKKAATLKKKEKKERQRAAKRARSEKKKAAKAKKKAKK